MTHQLRYRRFIAALVFGLPTLATDRAFAAEKTSPARDVSTDGASKPEKPAEITYDLRYKLKRGEVLRYDVSHRASVRTTIEKETQAAQSRTDSVKLWKVTDVLKNGEIEIAHVVARLHMVNQLPDKDPTEYDSDHDKTPPLGFEDAARAVGVPLSIVRMTPRGKIERRDIKAPGIAAEDDTPIALRLPEKRVAIGDTWDEPFDVVVAIEGGKKQIQTRRHHELLDVEKEIATIKVTYQVLSPIDSAIECQLVQRLMEGEVKFNMASGRIVGQQMEIDKRILGFAGPTSSMQYIMRMDEKLLDAGLKVGANWPDRSPAAKSEIADGSKSVKETTTAARPATEGKSKKR
jgi:hypothetical protein